MEFEIWHIWLLASIACFILEMVIPSFVVFNFGLGAMVATITAGIGLSVEWQLLLFSAGTIASFFLIRPVVKKWAFRRSDKTATNIDAMIGRQGSVSENIDASRNTGRVKLDGDDWMAKSKDGSVIQCGEIVRITNVESIVVVVEKVS
jgi:membrane protein implicated in regulation of membrane protease activity